MRIAGVGDSYWRKPSLDKIASPTAVGATRRPHRSHSYTDA